jgi:ribosomal protein S18 acetylase RimI-like enzyme
VPNDKGSDSTFPRLKARGCEKVNLLIESANSGVQEFYKKMGYSHDGLIFMEKWLA